MSARSIRRHAILLPLALLYLVPIYILFVNVFKTNQDILGSPLGLPLDRLTLDNLAGAIGDTKHSVISAYGNTLVITVASVSLAVIVGSMLAYVVARQRAAVFRVLYFLIIAGLLIPPATVLIPAVRVLAALHLLGTMPGLILLDVATYLPFTMFIYASFIHTIPRELDEAAEVDGANHFRTFWAVIFPLLRPVTASVVVFLAITAWNDLLNPLIVLGSAPDDYVVTTRLLQALGLYYTNYQQVFPFFWLAAVPILILFIVMQRQFVSGLTQGAVKG